MLMPLVVSWEGKFRKGSERITRTMTFRANTEDVAYTIVASYVQVQKDKGWSLLENKVTVIHNAGDLISE